MKVFTEKLHEELLSKLDELDKNYDPNNLFDPRLRIVMTAIDQIKVKLLDHRFASDEEEIHYFKSVLPKTLALYIYYSERVQWDRIIMLDSPRQKYIFHDHIYSVAEDFRKEYSAVYEYYRDGKTDLDDLYFLRSSPLHRETTCSVGHIIDPCSPPYHSILLAILIAYTMLEFEVKICVAENDENALSGRHAKIKLRWTGKQSEIIELGYGLKEMGSFNNGTASLKEIFEYLGEVFGVETGNTSRLFQDIVGRKSGYTTFLDQMREKLLKRIQDMLD
jgi:RteC protein